jgi:hypothetical protein
MHHHDGRSVSECQQDLTKTGSLPRFGRRLATGSTAGGPAGFKESQKGAIVHLDRGSSGECRTNGRIGASRRKVLNYGWDQASRAKILLIVLTIVALF